MVIFLTQMTLNVVLSCSVSFVTVQFKRLKFKTDPDVTLHGV